MATRSRGNGKHQNGNGSADANEIEKAAKARAAAGHNSGEPPDEVIERDSAAYTALFIELDAQLVVVQGIRSRIGAQDKATKKACGSQAWVNAIKAGVQIARRAQKGATGEIVTEHRQMNRVLKLLNVPLGTQFNLFAVAGDAEAEASGGKNALDAELQGQAAWRNKEPRENNPFQAGTDDFVRWDTGYVNAEGAALQQIGKGNGAEAH